MHIVFILLSVPLILLGCVGLFRGSAWVMDHFANADWDDRRAQYLLALVAPLVALGIGLSGLHDFLVRVCGLSEQVWYTFIVGGLLVMACIAGGAAFFSLVRLYLLERSVRRDLRAASPIVQIWADEIASTLGGRSTFVWVRDENTPTALTWGICRPQLLLSTWMTTHLDQDELKAVLAHELAHVKRRDFFVTWLTTLLRDAFFYLPASRAAYLQIKRENELACDELAAQATGEPLALASALVKIWRFVLEPTQNDFAPALTGTRQADDIELRIERLIESSDDTDSTHHASTTRSSAFSVHKLGWWALGVLLLVNVVLMVGPLGCNLALTICR